MHRHETRLNALPDSAATSTSHIARSARAHADNTRPPRAAQDPRRPFRQREHTCAHLRRGFPSVGGLRGARGADRCSVLRVVFDMIKAQGPGLV